MNYKAKYGCLFNEISIIVDAFVIKHVTNNERFSVKYFNLKQFETLGNVCTILSFFCTIPYKKAYYFQEFVFIELSLEKNLILFSR